MLVYTWYNVQRYIGIDIIHKQDRCSSQPACPPRPNWCIAEVVNQHTELEHTELPNFAIQALFKPGFFSQLAKGDCRTGCVLRSCQCCHIKNLWKPSDLKHGKRHQMRRIGKNPPEGICQLSAPVMASVKAQARKFQRKTNGIFHWTGSLCHGVFFKIITIYITVQFVIPYIYPKQQGLFFCFIAHLG